MATASDVIHALTGMHESIARRLDDAPTGVTPGYSAALRGTVLPNGKLRYVEGSGAGAVGVHVERTSNFALTTSGSDYSIDFDSEDYDDAAYWDSGASPLADIVVPSTGYYMAEFTVEFASNATGYREAYVTSSFVCGAQLGGRVRIDASGSAATILSGAGVYRLAAGCVLRLHAVQTSGGALNVSAASCRVIKMGAIV